eukprot:m.189286 g.189286  ORF g.189286 m.189286 type:complete len:286 (-) comp32369_c3_seq3:1835-2692(-)
MSYTTEARGSKNTLNYKLYYKDGEGNYISPMHDIPAWADKANGIVNMVCEVPRWTNAKMEIAVGQKLNPIIQDSKKGKARFVHNCFPHHGYIWNYGAIPQTWENPTYTDPHTNCKGDCDPIDICDIGELVAKPGEVKQVKVLGVMAMIDEGETDWKVIGIDVNDPNASKMNDIDDVDKVFPGHIAATSEWFRIYKIPAGKPANSFAFDGEAKNKEFACDIIGQTQKEWKELMEGEGFEKINCSNTTQEKNKLTQAECKALVDAEPPLADETPLDPSVHKWHYIKL